MRHGKSNKAAARELGLPYGTFRTRVDVGRRRGFHLSVGAKSVVDSAKLGYVEAKGGWVHSYDDDGKKIGATRWTAEEPTPEDLADRIRAALDGVSPIAPIAPPQYVEDDLLTVYPLADVHIGMMAWGRETGEDYDTKIAADRLRNWIGRAVDAAPPAGTAVILGVGDLTHADDQSNMTPRSKHVLDVDTRHFKTLETTIAALAWSIEYAALKHDRVIVRILPGNHDMNTYLAVMFALSQRYRADGRIVVQTVPGEFWVHRHGKCLLAAHHGHGGKPERMVMFLADEHAAEWGKTSHRTLWTGHLHHAKLADIGGVTWEQLRAVTARDAYAVSHAYVARAELQAITFDKERGEIMRVKVRG